MSRFADFIDEIRPVIGNEIIIITEGLVSTEVRNLLVGGKRLRAGLLWAITDKYLPEPTTFKFGMIRDLSCAVELAHASSLIVDDMIDEDNTRRGVKTLHFQFGHKKAMLATIGLLSIPYMVVGKYGENYVEHLARTQQGMVAGALSEIKPLKDLPASSIYDFVITRKTGMLFGLAARYGAMAADLDENIVELYTKYGLHVGKAMQIADDIADLTKIIHGAKESNFGSEMILLKCVGADQLLKSLISDIKNKTIDISKAKLLWNTSSTQIALCTILENEIKNARVILNQIDIFDPDDILVLAPKEIAQMMLTEE